MSVTVYAILGRVRVACSPLDKCLESRILKCMCLCAFVVFSEHSVYMTVKF